MTTNYFHYRLTLFNQPLHSQYYSRSTTTKLFSIGSMHVSTSSWSYLSLWTELMMMMMMIRMMVAWSNIRSQVWTVNDIFWLSWSWRCNLSSVVIMRAGDTPHLCVRANMNMNQICWSQAENFMFWSVSQCDHYKWDNPLLKPFSQF